jgi:hypothetical protein
LFNNCLHLKLIHRLYISSSSSWMSGSAALSTWQASLVTSPAPLGILAPLYRSITTCVVHDGKSTSLWYDVWCLDDDIPTKFLALKSHSKMSGPFVFSVLSHPLVVAFVPRFSDQAKCELDSLNTLLWDIKLSDVPVESACLPKRRLLPLRAPLQNAKNPWGPHPLVCLHLEEQSTTKSLFFLHG